MQPQLPPDFIEDYMRMKERLALVEKALTNDAIQIGSIIEWPGPTSLLPFNYLPADGRAIDRIGYASYFAQIGTTFGTGDGSTSFNIPNRGPRIFLDAGAARSGCVALDGASYLRTTYPDLFNYFGGASSPWGLPDGTHFNVPDMRGRAAIGAGTGAGLTARTLGTQNIGEENHQLTIAELAAHTHNTAATVVFNSGSGGNLGTAGTYNQGATTTTSTGSDTAHNTMQPSGVYNFFIETTNTSVVKVL